MKMIIPKKMSLLDALTHLAPDSSKNTIKGWLKAGRVTVAGKVITDPKSLVEEGKEIIVGTRVKFVPMGVRILYEDNFLVAIDKPSGLLSVPTAFEKEETAYAVLKKYYHPRKVHIVHRLDQETSGVMLFALNEEGKEGLKYLLERHQIERTYIAIVEGHLEKKKGKWESYLYEDPVYKVHSTTDKSKGSLAITHYEVIAESKKQSALKLNLETGKKNQIRVHCHDAGTPVVGDFKYGAATDTIKRLCLHAYKLKFNHPAVLKTIGVVSPIPESFHRLVKINEFA